ncbi:MAG: hypothetical protein K1060chlam1_00996 [Candidatus Anoxychlamydiales bacterium]|nr:hypothetical protein [Candidatus Anoxychlamydiales bacterium]
MSVSLESLVPLANNFAQTKITSDKQTTNYEKARKALKSDFKSQIASLPLKLLDLDRILTSFTSCDQKVAKKVQEWIKKLAIDSGFKITVGGAIILLNNTLLYNFDLAYKSIQTNAKYLEFREAKKAFKTAIKDLKSQGKTAAEIESFLKTNKVFDRAVRKALYWYKYKI